MKISFVIPAYNEEEVISKCLESVQKELARTPCEAEVVVVNNASTDKTKEIALTFPGVRVVDEPIKGLPSARRAGFRATTGELVANIDSDGVLPPGWIQKALMYFANDPKLVVLTGPYIYYDLTVWERALVKIFYFPGWFFNFFTQYIFGRATMLQGGNFILRRDVWEHAGGFDTSIPFYGEDADVARRICAYGKVLWTWRFPILSSGRRLREEGIILTSFNYTINLFWVHLFGRPFNMKPYIHPSEVKRENSSDKKPR